ncbi:MAG: hypothetical protein M3H12_09055 [Chromatiales bacterium]|nr:ParB N-terminal domain-containing protein [Gammaproteobacteria bacterium]
MTGKRPTEEELSGLLNASHFGDETAELPPGDPVTVVQLVLTLEQIKPYDRNPRRDRNPRYDEIKASIRAQQGLNTPLNVTKRPGDTLHMVEAGGNTRLQILQELWEETKDACFHRIDAQYRPWVSESYVLTAHLVENELRGEMTLLDKSLGLQVLKEQLEEEAGTPLNRSEFVRKLKTVGYTVSRRQIIRMQYLAERLYPPDSHGGTKGSRAERDRHSPRYRKSLSAILEQPVWRRSGGAVSSRLWRHAEPT